MKVTKRNTADFILIIIIFGCTGLSTVYISSLITDFFGLEKWNLVYIIVYILFIFPTYHLLLLGYAFIFGKFDFFWGRLKIIKSKISSWNLK